MLVQTFFIYVLVLVVVFILLTWLGIRVRSAVVISLVVGLIVISIICPISSIEKVLRENNPWVRLYGLIYIVTVLAVIIYIFLMGWNDLAYYKTSSADSGSFTSSTDQTIPAKTEVIMS